MSVEYFEGFETIGTETGLSNEATISARLDLRMEDTGSGIAHASTGYFLIDDYLSEGYAICMGTNSSSNTCYFDVPIPESIQLGGASASTPGVVVGMLLHTPNKAGRSASFFQVRGEYNAGIGYDNQFYAAYNDDELKITFGSGMSIRYTTVTGVFTPGAWHYVELKFKCADQADGGYLYVNVDEVNVLTQDPIDLNNSCGVEAYERFRFQGTYASTDLGDYTAFDDIYILDVETAPNQDFLGAVRVRSLPPNADNQREWSNSASDFTNYDKVDENDADDADYIETDQNGYTDIYECTDTDTDYSDDIYAVKIEAEAINTTGGTPELEFQLISGSSQSTESQVVDDTVNYEVLSIISATDPDTSLPWTTDGVDALKLGLKFDNGL